MAIREKFVTQTMQHCPSKYVLICSSFVGYAAKDFKSALLAGVHWILESRGGLLVNWILALESNKKLISNNRKRLAKLLENIWNKNEEDSDI